MADCKPGPVQKRCPACCEAVLRGTFPPDVVDKMKGRVSDIMPRAGIVGNTLIFPGPNDYSSFMVALAIGIVCKRTVVHLQSHEKIIEPYDHYAEMIHSLFRRAAKVGGPTIIFFRLQSDRIPAGSTFRAGWLSELVRTRPPESIVIAMRMEPPAPEAARWHATFSDIFEAATNTGTTSRPRDQSQAWMEVFNSIYDIAWTYLASKDGVLPPRPLDTREHWNRVAALGVD